MAAILFGIIGLAGSTQAAPQALPENSGPQEFFVRLYLPLGYTSNPLQDFVAGPTAPASAEIDPEIQLGWIHHLARAPLQLAFKAGSERDSFLPGNAASYARAFASFRVTYDTGRDDQAWQPFLIYAPTGYFTANYARRTDMQNDIVLGMDKMFNFDAQGRRLSPGADSAGDAAFSVGFTARLQRRLATPGPASSAIIAGPWASWYFADEWNATLECDAIRRWYDQAGSAGARERTWLINPLLTLAWLPGAARFGSAARRHAFGRPEIDFNLSFARLDSTVPAHGFSQWQTGPTILAKWWF